MAGVREWQGRIDLHKAYLRDRARNTAYRRAIERAVTARTASRVLDIGSGTGIWACVAARAGAKRVVAVEWSEFAEVARETVKRNGLSGRVEVIRGDVTQYEPRERFDLVIHELVGGLLWEEDMLRILRDAKERLLEGGGTILPGRVELRALPYALPGDAYDGALWGDTIEGFDFGHLEPLDRAQWARARTARCVHGVYDERRAVASPASVYRAKLGEDVALPPGLAWQFTATRDATVTGVLCFFDIELDAETRLSTAPWDPATNWGQLYVPAAEPLRVAEGATHEASLVPAMTRNGFRLTLR
jgi:protein arginine N-methyltransferase 1